MSSRILVVPLVLLLVIVVVDVDDDDDDDGGVLLLIFILLPLPPLRIDVGEYREAVGSESAAPSEHGGYPLFLSLSLRSVWMTSCWAACRNEPPSR